MAHAGTRRMAVAVAALTLSGCVATPATPPTDDPATVRVAVYMRDQSGTELWVQFPSTQEGGSGRAAGVTSSVTTACYAVPAGATVAVLGATPDQIRLPLYTAIQGDADQTLWVESGPGGELRQGTGRPAWGTTDPEC